jgi:hypothetical protein
MQILEQTLLQLKVNLVSITHELMSERAVGEKDLYCMHAINTRFPSSATDHVQSGRNWKRTCALLYAFSMHFT